MSPACPETVLACICALGCSLVLAAPAQAVTLVNPNGTPTGGELQQWANAAQVPTLNGPLRTDTAVSDVNTLCAGAPACSTAPAMAEQEPNGSLIYASGQPAETWVAPGAVVEWQFDFELGHQFDYAYLTGTDRAMLAQTWGSTLHWWDTFSGLSHGIEDGLEAEFADIYATCAVDAEVPAILTTWLPGVAVENAAPTCELIDQIGAACDADMPASFSSMPAAAAAVSCAPSAPGVAKGKLKRKHERKRHKRLSSGAATSSRSGNARGR